MPLALKLVSLSKAFFDIQKRLKTEVVKDFSLDIETGELISILGPSGCGKTTLLRMIAGLEESTSGEIYFEDRLMNEIPAHKRNFVMMFQNPSLFPHMTVRENISYGLELRKVSKKEIVTRFENILKLVKLNGLEARYPHELSGGQQQRVALARALIVEPKVLLLDEPLSQLENSLRLELRKEIRVLQSKLKITTILVTHDEEEAEAISDRIVLMENGKIQRFRPKAMKLL